MLETRDNPRYFYSYKSLFRINFKIYDVGGKVLPRAVPLDALFLAAIIYLPLFPLGWLIKPSHPWLATCLLAGGAAWLLSQADPQGKFLPVFIADITGYLLRPKKTNLAGQPVRSNRRHMLGWRVMEVIDD